MPFEPKHKHSVAAPGRRATCATMRFLVRLAAGRLAISLRRQKLTGRVAPYGFILIARSTASKSRATDGLQRLDEIPRLCREWRASHPRTSRERLPLRREPE